MEIKIVNIQSSFSILNLKECLKRPFEFSLCEQRKSAFTYQFSLYGESVAIHAVTEVGRAMDAFFIQSIIYKAMQFHALIVQLVFSTIRYK